MTINLRINEYLISKGIKQTYIAKKVGISEDKLSNILNGKRKISATEYLNLCEVLGVDPKTFNAGKEA